MSEKGQGTDSSGKVMAMYDVRGIQDYLFKSNKLKDIIGASAIVENIFRDALESARDRLIENGVLDPSKVNLEWSDENGPLVYSPSNHFDIEVMYIGGGNAVVLFSSRDLYKKLNRYMSEVIIRSTYSLRLAAACVDCGTNYSKDYHELNLQMARVKADMEEACPVGALPVMQIDKKSGFALVEKIYNKENKGEWISTESSLKKKAGREKRSNLDAAYKKFDNCVEEKGVDSTIAVVHIDGNNMGLRIRSLIENIDDYVKAINTMRQISWNIDSSYKKVYGDMERIFNNGAQQFFIRIIAAGDDITYVCRGKAALASIEYFSEQISKCHLNAHLKGSEYSENNDEYRFTVCAGIAFINSHFPFSAAYETAENCCSIAKEKAKKEENKIGTQVGSWFDFHICKNIYARDVKELRKKEYVTASGEVLCIRPYELPVLEKPEREDALDHYELLKKNIEFFQKEPDALENENEAYLPRSFSKQLRNRYSEGSASVEQFKTFINSRGWKMPDGTTAMYKEVSSEEKTALWYDAVELMDDYIPLSDFRQMDVLTQNTDPVSSNTNPISPGFSLLKMLIPKWMQSGIKTFGIRL